MIDADLYAKTNKMQREETEKLLKEYKNLFSWKNDGSEIFVDIGCGTGDVTMDLLRPVLPENIGQLIGTDIASKSIEFCKRKYGSSEKLDFMIADITSVDDCKKIPKADFVTSFYCLHWVKNQRLIKRS